MPELPADKASGIFPESDCALADDEVLFRRVPTRHVAFTDNGIEVSSNAFYSSDRKISFNRARLMGNDPSLTQNCPEDGVCKILAGEVKRFSAYRRVDGKEQTDIDYVARAFADPIKDDPIIPDNPAHAEIRTMPGFTDRPGEKKLVQKLLEAIALIINSDPEEHWAILPKKAE